MTILGISFLVVTILVFWLLHKKSTLTYAVILLWIGLLYCIAAFLEPLPGSETITIMFTPHTK